MTAEQLKKENCILYQTLCKRCVYNEGYFCQRKEWALNQQLGRNVGCELVVFKN